MSTYHEDLRARVEALRQAAREQLTQFRAERESRAQAVQRMLSEARQTRLRMEHERLQASEQASEIRMHEILRIRELSYLATHYGSQAQVDAEVRVGGVLSELFRASTPLADETDAEKPSKRSPRRGKSSVETQPQAESNT